MRHASVFWLAACGALAACSQIVGAEFDGLEPLDASSGGSVAGSAGAPGGSGNSSGGAMSAGGSAGKAGSGGGGAGKGGSSGDAGSAGNTQSGGSAGAGGSAGSGGVGGSDVGGAGTGGNAGSSGSAGTGGGGAGGGGQCPGTGGASGETGIVINEIKGQGPGDDYIEIFNKGSAAVDVSNHYLSDDSGNEVRFSAGTLICGRSYVIGLLQQTSSGGPHTCFGFSPCFWGMTWGVSAAGEAVFLYSASGVLLDQLTYPNEAGPNGVADGQAYGRLTDGSETLGAITHSPGQPNQAAN